MVTSVARAKSAATRTTPPILRSAAGYMSKGISGSHGPSTKTTNSVQAVAPAKSRRLLPGLGVGRVRMGVLAEVVVPVAVDGAVRVRRAGGCAECCAESAADAPGEVGEAEAQEQPAGELAARGFPPGDVGEGPAQGQAEGAEQHGSRDVAEAADQGDGQGAAAGPAAAPGKGDEGQVVVRPEEGVDHADRDRGRCQQRQLAAHWVPLIGKLLNGIPV